jgi:hypothetical protein
MGPRFLGVYCAETVNKGCVGDDSDSVGVDSDITRWILASSGAVRGV